MTQHLFGHSKHPRNIQVMVRPHKFYRAPDMEDGSHGPFSTLYVCKAELDLARHLLVEVGSDEHEAIMRAEHGEPVAVTAPRTVDEVEEAPKPKRRRGRPRKNPVSED